jgi:hypothetical protein
MSIFLNAECNIVNVYYIKPTKFVVIFYSTNKN